MARDILPTTAQLAKRHCKHYRTVGRKTRYPLPYSGLRHITHYRTIGQETVNTTVQWAERHDTHYRTVGRELIREYHIAYIFQYTFILFIIIKTCGTGPSVKNEKQNCL